MPYMCYACVDKVELDVYNLCYDDFEKPESVQVSVNEDYHMRRFKSVMVVEDLRNNIRVFSMIDVGHRVHFYFIFMLDQTNV